MNIFKKFFVVFTSAVSICILAMNSITVFAAEKSLSPAESAPYTVLMGINADKELWEQKGSNFQTFSNDGDYNVSYAFQTGGSNISALVLDTDLKADEFPNATITVNKIVIIKAENGYGVEVPFDASKAVQTQNANGCIRLNILYNYGQATAKAIDTSLPETANISDELAINFTISGLSSDSAVTTTTTEDTSVVTDISATTTIPGTLTNTVSQTADPGVVTIIVSGVASAALAAGALTVKRKKK